MKPRKDGYYHKNFTYEERRYHISAATEKELMIKYGKMLQQLADGSLMINQNSTVEHWAKVWLETYKKGNVTNASYNTYANKIDGYILPAIGRMKMKDVKEPHLQRILNDERGRSFSHVSKLRMVIRSMFRRAMSAGIINRDPAANLILPKATKGTHRSISEQERSAILSVAAQRDDNGSLLVLIMLYCGLRPGEAIALQWKDIDFDNAIIHVTKAKEAGSNTIKGPKTEAGNRDIPIPDQLLLTLRRHKRGPFEQVLHRARNKDLPHSDMSAQSAWKTFKGHVYDKMGRVNKNDELSLYCLRHTYCTDLQDAGVPINIAKYLMGHTDIKMTANIYTHTSDEAIKKAAISISAYYRDGKKLNGKK